MNNDTIIDIMNNDTIIDTMNIKIDVIYIDIDISGI